MNERMRKGMILGIGLMIGGAANAGITGSGGEKDEDTSAQELSVWEQMLDILGITGSGVEAEGITGSGGDDTVEAEGITGSGGDNN